MKPFLLLFALIIFHFFACSQPKISKITWVGENNQYLNLTKKKPTLQQGSNYKQFERTKYAKDYIILSEVYHSKKIEQKYKVVHFTQDTLILAPKGEDVFALSEANEQNQYVFVNSMLSYKFVSIYYETSFYNFDNPKDKLKFILCIDSAKNSRVLVQNESFSEGTMYTAPPSKVEYERLIKILSSYDFSHFPEEENIEIDKESPYQILEISYNDQMKNISGFSLPANFANELGYFMCEYIELRANINVPWGWRILIRQRKA